MKYKSKITHPPRYVELCLDFAPSLLACILCVCFLQVPLWYQRSAGGGAAEGEVFVAWDYHVILLQVTLRSTLVHTRV